MCRLGEQSVFNLRRSYPNVDGHADRYANPNTRAKRVDGSGIGNRHARASVPAA